MTENIGYWRHLEELLTNRVIELKKDMAVLAESFINFKEKERALRVQFFSGGHTLSDRTNLNECIYKANTIERRKEFVKLTLDLNQELLDRVEEKIYQSKLEDPTIIRANFDSKSIAF